MKTLSDNACIFRQIFIDTSLWQPQGIKSQLQITWTQGQGNTGEQYGRDQLWMHRITVWCNNSCNTTVINKILNKLDGLWGVIMSS